MDELAGTGATPQIGATAMSGGRTITEADLVSFAALTGDWHPQHSDAEWASRGRFGERVAHGMLVLSYAVGLMAFDPERVVALRGLDAATFKRPVRIGDTIRVRSRVEQVRPLDSAHALVAFAWRIVNQDDQVAVRARLEALWRLEREDQRGDVSANGGPVDADELYAGTVLL